MDGVDTAVGQQRGIEVRGLDKQFIVNLNRVGGSVTQ
jgi:hypothetical protein